VRAQRLVSATGVVMVARQTVALGRVHAGKTVTIDVTDTDLIVACDDGPRTIRRTSQLPIRTRRTVRTAAGLASTKLLGREGYHGSVLKKPASPFCRIRA
jgi:hypothetical protein